MKKVKRVRIKFKNVLIFIGILGLLISTICLFMGKKINNIYITGNVNLREQDIIELLRIDDYPKYYQISSSLYEKRLKTSPLIKNAKIKKSLNSITIEVSEYDILWYQEYNDSYIISNGESIYLDDKILGIPVVVNQVDEDYYDKFIDKMMDIEHDILVKISEISYEPSTVDKERFLLYMNDHNYVYLTLKKFDAINNYDNLVPKLEGKKGILYLDSGNHFEIKK